MHKAKKTKRAIWPKKIGKSLTKILKEKQKTIKQKEQNQRKILKQKEKEQIQMRKVKAKLHRKAIKARKKNVEKKLDWLLAGGFFLVCLTASLLETKREKKQKASKSPSAEN